MPFAYACSIGCIPRNCHVHCSQPRLWILAPNLSFALFKNDIAILRDVGVSPQKILFKVTEFTCNSQVPKGSAGGLATSNAGKARLRIIGKGCKVFYLALTLALIFALARLTRVRTVWKLVHTYHGTTYPIQYGHTMLGIVSLPEVHHNAISVKLAAANYCLQIHTSAKLTIFDLP